jgi:nucleotide-binding universal stress UspA family protein
VTVERVVVGVDFSESSRACASWVATHIARGAELVLVHVLHVSEPPALLRPLYDPPDRLVETARAGAEHQLREMSRAVATGLVWTEVREGRPEEELARVAAEYGARLVAVGAHGHREGGIRHALGTTADRVLRRSVVPVLVAKGAMGDAPRTLLVAIDDSAETGAVLRWTRSLAERFGASVTALHAVSPARVLPPDFQAMGGTSQSAAVYEASEAALRSAAERWIGNQLEESGLGDRASVVVTIGSPSVCVLEEASARGADLIIMGSGRPGLVRRTVLGSVAESVIRDADRPVLVVPPEPSEEGASS